MTAAPASERAAESLVLRSYQLIQAQLLDELEVVLRSVETPAQARRSKRITDLLAHIEQRIQMLATTVEQQTIAGQRTAIVAATANPLPVGVDVQWNRLPAAAFEDMVGRLADGMPLADYLAGYGRDAALAARSALLSSLAKGVGPRAVAQQVAAALDVSRTKALLITRQSIITSYRAAALASYTANDDVVKGWRWSAAKSTRTCALCWALDGQEFPLSELFASHLACRCAPAPVTRSWDELGIEGVPEPPRRPTGTEVFDALPDGDKALILGPGKLRLYREGKLRLADLVVETDGGRWGPGKRQATLRELLA